MKIFVHSAFNDSTISSTLGRADYSYYYVRKMFEPLLTRLGDVVAVDDPASELEPLVENCNRRREPCVYLSFTPPHKMWMPDFCPGVPVFAWEYGTLPDEEWADNPRNNWVAVLSQCAGAITHSVYARDVTRRALGQDFPIIPVPAPLWESMQDSSLAPPRPPQASRVYEFAGLAYDTLNQPPLTHDVDRQPLLDALLADNRRHVFTLSGVIYTAIFNPNDGRKNWPDLLHAFCWAFRQQPDATLLIKLTHHDPVFSLSVMLHELAKVGPLAARIILLHGYLDPVAYKQLVAASHYTINSSYGEGQCLPLMEFMAAGRPVIAPLHTAMLDYLDEATGFPVRSSREWTHWPHDPRSLKRTYRHRLDWQDLVDALRDSHRLASERWQDYESMSVAARSRSRLHCSREALQAPVKTFLDTVCRQWVQARKQPTVASLSPSDRQTPLGRALTRLIDRLSKRLSGVDNTLRILAHDPRMVGLRDAVGSGWYQSVSSEIVTGFDVGAGKTVIDIGCGDGGAGLFALRQGARVILADVTDAKFQQIRKAATDAGTAMPECLVCDAAQVPLETGSVDRVMAMEILEHTRNPDDVLAELARLCKPGGLLLLSVPDHTVEHLYQGIAPASFWSEPNHIQIFSPDDIVRRLGAPDWELLDTKGWGFYWTFSLMLFWLSRKTGPHTEDHTALDQIAAPYDPLLVQWSALWNSVLDLPEGPLVKQRLDTLLPRSRLFIARRLGSSLHR